MIISLSIFTFSNHSLESLGIYFAKKCQCSSKFWNIPPSLSGTNCLTCFWRSVWTSASLCWPCLHAMTWHSLTALMLSWPYLLKWTNCHLVSGVWCHCAGAQMCVNVCLPQCLLSHVIFSVIFDPRYQFGKQGLASRKLLFQCSLCTRPHHQ